MTGQKRLRKMLLRLARTALGGALLRLWLRLAPGRLPLKPLYRSRALLVIPHPAPAYPIHLLFLPLPPLPGLNALSKQHARMLTEVVNTAHRLAMELALPPSSRLVVNGGAYQEVAVLHFHLVSQHPAKPDTFGEPGPPQQYPTHNGQLS